MLPNNKKQGQQIIKGIWIFNVIALIGITITLVYYITKRPISYPISLNITSTQISSVSAENPSSHSYAIPMGTLVHSPTPIIGNSATPFAPGKRPITIGYSVAGRPLEVYQFGIGSVERMIIAGIHGGNEWNTIVLADELITFLQEHDETIPVDKTLFILRNLNPDGEARAHTVDGRANDHGVDLNHNWPLFWQPDWRRDDCWNYRPLTAGAYPASEPETASLMNFISLHKIDALISYHSAALGIFPGGRPPDPASISLAKAAAAVSGYEYPPVNTDCDFTGNLADWASAQNIAAIDIELTNHTDSEFDRNFGVLITLLNWKK